VKKNIFRLECILAIILVLGVEALIEHLEHETFDEIVEKVNSANLSWKAGKNFNSNYKPQHVAGEISFLLGFL
jgi:hypothetical protein